MQQNNPYKFTYIIAYKNRPDRLMNLRRVIDWVSGFVGIELIIIEQDRKPQIENLVFSRPIKYLFLQTDMPFNKAWAFNVAAKQATTDTIIFGDSDLIMDPNDFIEGLKILESNDCVSPYNRVIDLKQEELGFNLDQMKAIDRPGRGETDIQKICLSGGIIMYKRSALEKIGGWAEDFIGWGGEDDAQSYKSEKLLKCIEAPAKCYHLWHQPEQPIMALYQRNLQILNQIKQMDEANLLRYIGNSVGKAGLKNRLN